MSNAYFRNQEPTNEPYHSYAPGTPERASLKKRLKEMKSEVIQIPAIIGGKEVRTGKDRKSTRLNSSHVAISYAVFCLKKKRGRRSRARRSRYRAARDRG